MTVDGIWAHAELEQFLYPLKVFSLSCRDQAARNFRLSGGVMEGTRADFWKGLKVKLVLTKNVVTQIPRRAS
jgi:hypothetical protein